MPSVLSDENVPSPRELIALTLAWMSLSCGRSKGLSVKVSIGISHHAFATIVESEPSQVSMYSENVIPSAWRISMA